MTGLTETPAQRYQRKSPATPTPMTGRAETPARPCRNDWPRSSIRNGTLIKPKRRAHLSHTSRSSIIMTSNNEFFLHEHFETSPRCTEFYTAVHRILHRGVRISTPRCGFQNGTALFIIGHGAFHPRARCFPSSRSLLSLPGRAAFTFPARRVSFITTNNNSYIHEL